MDLPALRDLLWRQDGVVARRQLVGDLGLRCHDIDRLRRHRDLVDTVPGVYVEHTGPLSWAQQAWVGVLATWPAALGHRSALPSPLAERDPVIHVLVDRKRTLRPPRGIRVHHISGFDERVEWQRSPPRQRLPDATLDAALAERTVASRFQVIADVLQTRRTTVAQIGAALQQRNRIPRRAELAAMLADLASGANSMLEREYLRLESAHGLPAADRQRAGLADDGRVYRDAPYPAYGLIVELDGRAFHDTASARHRDLERDLDALVTDCGTTVRLGYAQVFDHGCRTVAKVAELLTHRGWPGPLQRCPRCPRPVVP